MTTRRTFLRSGALFSAAVAAPRPLFAWLGHAPEPAPPIEDPRLRDLARRALDAATAAGAAYADARLTYTRTRQFRVTPEPGIYDYERMHIGVRALVNGYWGFAASTLWHPDEAARLGRESAAQARVNTLSRPRVVTLAPAPVVRDGHWETPVETPALDVYPIEMLDYLQGLSVYLRRLRNVKIAQNYATFLVQDKAFAATTDSYCTQRTHAAGGVLTMIVANPRTDERTERAVPGLTTAGVGAELYWGQSIPDRMRATYDATRADLELPVKPVDVNRYDVVFDAASVAPLVSATIGAASELDRALGYEANAGGTSYLNDPAAMTGSFAIGNDRLTVTADRTTRGGAATVRWDDDGVEPRQYDVVRNGILRGYQTSRESAGWLPGGGASMGGAYAPDASYAPLTHTANLTVRPGSGDLASFESGIKKGVSFCDLGVDMDFQQLNGFGMGRAYELKDGKRTARLAAAAVLFRAPELWKSLQAVGGAAAAERIGRNVSKGEPAQDGMHSVTAVPMQFKDVSVIDPRRKA